MAPQVKKSPSVLIAIASYGRAQDHYLSRIVAEYRALNMQTRIVVLSNVHKTVPGAEVRVGLPSRDPYSLPFAHRHLFSEHVDAYDLFIYSEDDTLITGRQIDAFLSVQPCLEEDEVAGFLRYEIDQQGHQFITSLHHHFRWETDSVVERGGHLYARVSNQHSGCFMVTQQQLRRAITSGGFLVAPHAEMYGMLESAASDLYTQCGLRRLVSLTDIENFIVPHLPNKYYSAMGVPCERFSVQVNTLRNIRESGGWTGRLFDPCSGEPGFRWSKDLYERPDEELLNIIPRSAKSVLSVGCGWGETEATLRSRGMSVVAMPLDGVFNALARQRGITTLSGPFDATINAFRGEQFDIILLSDVLHLIENSVAWLRKLRCLLRPNGQLIASVPNTSDFVEFAKDWHKGRAGTHTRDQRRRVQRVSQRLLRQWCLSAGLTVDGILPLTRGSKRSFRTWAVRFGGSALASRFIVSASRRESKQ